jgi:hypothetical protein
MFASMNASQRSPAIPIFGRNRATGLRGWVRKKISHVIFYDVGEFFDAQCDHIQTSRAGDVLDSKKQSKKK